MSGLSKRVLANGASTFYGMVVIALGQLATVPLFLSTWGSHLYGEWLVVSALPAYLAMSDFGLGPVAANRIAMLAGSGEAVEAEVTLHSIWVFQLLLALVVFLSASVVAWWVPLGGYFGFSAFSESDLRVVLIGLSTQVLLVMLSGVFQAMYRSSSRNARGALVANTVRLAEVVAVITGLYLGGGVREVVYAMLAARFAGFCVTYWDVRRISVDLQLGVGHYSGRELRFLLKPALGQVTFALANAIQLQGFTLVINHLLGPMAVASYNVLRTVVRTCSQGVMVVNWSVYPEFSTLVAQNAMDKARQLHQLAVQLSVWGSLLFCAVLVLVGPYLIPLWTRGKIPYDGWLICILCMGVILNSFWNTSSVVLTSTNNQARLGYIYSGCSLLGLALGYVGGMMCGLYGIAIMAFIAELGMLFYVFGAACSLLGDKPLAVLKSIVDLLSLVRMGCRHFIMYKARWGA